MKRTMRFVERWQEAGAIIAWPLWLLLLFTIPVTSSPIVASFSGGETPVSPLALIPLILIIVCWLLPFMVNGKELPKGAWPLVGFLLAAMLSGFFAMRLFILPYKGITQIDRTLRAFVTFGIGFAFFMTAATLPTGERRVRSSLKALYLGLVLMLLWSSVQAYLVLDGSERMPLIVTRIHHIFSVRDPIPDRVTGMAFEPSWAADQLVVLYIPLLLASVAHKWSVFPFIRKGISIELLLLAWCGAILILTKSRVTLFGVLVFLLIACAIVGIPRLRGWIKRMFDPPSKGFVSFEVAYAAAIFTLISSLAALAIGVVLVFKETDPRAANLFSAPKRLEEFQYFYPNEGVYELANELAFAERIVYWDFGFHTFSDHPLLGVGPGNAGFFFEQNLPPYGYGLTEIRNVLDLGEYGFPNPKNLWLRLLSETGILGFSIYVCWYVFIAASAFLLLRSGAMLEKVVALSGLMVVVIQLFEGFSLDTFALPQMWIVFGFVALVSSSRYQQTRNPAVEVHAVST